MAIDFSVDPDRGLITYVVSGETTLGEIIQAADQVLADPSFEPGMNGLWDLREGSLVALTSDDLRELAGYFRSGIPQRGSGFREAAVAPRDLEFGLVRMLDVFGENLPSQGRVFRDIEEARRWLEE